MSIYANAEHGIVCSMPDRYFGWPSVAKLGDGTIVAGCSGLRRAHVCPWGKSVVFYSTDGGKTYSEPQIVHDDMIDDRDLGITAMGGQKYGITWFALDTRRYNLDECLAPEDVAEGKQIVASWPDEEVKRLQGGWLKITEDGGKTWSEPIMAPVSAPHGFVALSDGTLGFLGRGYPKEDRAVSCDTTQYHISRDGGKTWIYMGDVTVEDEMVNNYCEPHLIELKDGSLMGALRFHPPGEETYDTALTFSKDGGKTWTYPRRLYIQMAPPHLLRHSSGAIVLVGGRRLPGYGQRAVVSYDEGQTWSDQIIIRDDGPHGDLGYPCSIELDDGSIYTVYYQYLAGQKKASLLWSRWTLPAK